jgi:hypothetical protein
MTACSLQVAHLTPVHHIDDERIFLKECRALRAASFNATLVRSSPTNCRIGGVHVVGVPTANGRLRRMTSTPALACLRAPLPLAPRCAPSMITS